MSLQSFAQFWANIRNLLPLPVVPDEWVEMRTLDVKANASEIEMALNATASKWMRPKTVTHYRPSDFEFLGTEDCGRLTKFVEDFRAAASQSDSARARGALVGILALFEFDRYCDPIAFQAGKRIETYIRDTGKPDYLTRLKFAAIEDHNGQPALGIWAFLSDSDDDEALARMWRLRPLLVEATHEAAPDRWPYIHFRTESEQAELERERKHLQSQEAA
jgi:hypothetical protein